MPWVAAGMAAAGAIGSIASSTQGAPGPRGINFTSAESNPWTVDAWKDTTGALNQQGQFVNALQQQGGVQNQSNVFNQQQTLANQLNQQAQGQGPNPALIQLQNATGQNTAQQASLMGSQRGAGANTGLIARQAAMQGGANQQAMAGQASVMQAQQQLAAQQALMQQQAQMAGLAGQQVGALGAASEGFTGANQNLLNANLGKVANWNSTQAGVGSSASSDQSKFASEQQQSQTKGWAGLMGGGASSLATLSKANGGTIPSYASGGPVSKFGQYCNMKSGGSVQGQASVMGNSSKNDTVPAMLSPGEGVIDRETLNAPGKIGQQARFVMAYINKKNGQR